MRRYADLIIIRGIHQMEIAPERYWQIHALERHRLTGRLLEEAIPGDLTVDEIVVALGVDNSPHLIAELYWAFPTMFDTDAAIHHGWRDAPESLRRAVAFARGAVCAAGKDGTMPLEGFDSVNNRKISDASEFETMHVVAEERTVEIASALVLHSDLMVPLHRSWKLQLPRFEIGRISRADAVSGSEILMNCEGDLYFDLAAFDGASDADFRHDQVVVGVTDTRVVVHSQKLDRESMHTINHGVWLAYPLGESWGHWLYEVMTRIALVSDSGLLGDRDLVVTEDVPSGFIEFVAALWPENKLIRVPSGMRVTIRDMLILNSPVLYAHGVHPSLGGHQRQLSCEPIGMSALRDRIRVVAKRIGGADALLPHVDAHLAREKAAHVISQNEVLLGEIAIDNGYLSVDPGSLTTREEILLFAGMRNAFGVPGSQMIGTIFAADGVNVLAVGHDQLDHDSRGFAWALRDANGSGMSSVLGARESWSVTRSERGFHQDFALSDAGWDVLRECVRGMSENGRSKLY